MVNKVTVLPGQSLVDIAVQEYGNEQGVFDLLDGNKHIEQKDSLTAGTVLKVINRPRNVLVAKWIKKYRLTIATQQVVFVNPLNVPKALAKVAGGKIRLLTGGKIKLLNG